MYSLTRRKFTGLLGASALTAVAGELPAPRFRIRTITAGVQLENSDDYHALHSAASFLQTARAAFSDEYEVQTVRLATQPLPNYLPEWLNSSSLAVIGKLDQVAKDVGAALSIGPVLLGNQPTPGFGSWAADLVQATESTSFSSVVASSAGGIHQHNIQACAEAIAAIARTSTGGEGNFRFCASAFCPPGTPFFPAAYHQGERAFSLGLESPGLLLDALSGTGDAAQSMRSHLNAALKPVESLAKEVSRQTGWRYLGIDTSPAPGLDASIGQVIETLAGAPFGSPSTLSACATITGVLKGLDVKTCGYSGLMLPVLEDRVLAARAMERRYGISELLLYSSVCGTGLDVIPLAGDTPVAGLAATIGDVAALSARYRKPLSARLFPIAGKQAGDIVSFDNPYLTSTRVMPLG